jgi:cytoskeletal protein CcmA (bactofilin family)
VFGKRKSDTPEAAPIKPQQAEPPPAIQPSAETAAEAPTLPKMRAQTDETSPIFVPVPPSFKESNMARSPFAPPPMPTAPTLPARATVTSTPARAETVERRTLVVGRGISVQGTVQDAERLVVEGTVEANSINGLAELSIAHGGVFKGEVEVEEAEIAGTIDGTLVARQTLVVRATGRVLGVARCRRLQVEDGGQITGRIEMMTDAGTMAEGKVSA